MKVSVSLETLWMHAQLHRVWSQIIKTIMMLHRIWAPLLLAPFGVENLRNPSFCLGYGRFDAKWGPVPSYECDKVRHNKLHAYLRMEVGTVGWRGTAYRNSVTDGFAQFLGHCHCAVLQLRWQLHTRILFSLFPISTPARIWIENGCFEQRLTKSRRAQEWSYPTMTTRRPLPSPSWRNWSMRCGLRRRMLSRWQWQLMTSLTVLGW